MGSINKNKGVPLSLYFAKYLLYLSIGAIITAFGGILAFNLLVSNHMVYHASYAQEQANMAQDKIADAKEVKEELIPELCRYMVFDSGGSPIGGNLSGSSAGNAWNAVQGAKTDGMGNYYKVIKRDGEYCVLSYQIVPQYRSEMLRKYLPNPQNLILIIVIVLLLLIVLVIAVRFGRSLKNKLQPILEATERIQEQDLDFTISPSDIKEIDNIRKSLDQMQTALKESLLKQWRAEQSHKEQMAALAHDLKTPLTIIRGNTELLEETELTPDQRECSVYIQDSAMQMQDYVKKLIEISHAEDNSPIEIRTVELSEFLTELRPKVEGLLASKKIELIWIEDRLPKTVKICPGLMIRALLNIFSNAADFTPQDGRVEFRTAVKEGTLQFMVSDSGPGFSAKAIAGAAQRFYMEDESRTQSMHYGMGLYIADTIVKKHGGKLKIRNSLKLKGAEVTVSIPGPYY